MSVHEALRRAVKAQKAKPGGHLYVTPGQAKAILKQIKRSF